MQFMMTGLELKLSLKAVQTCGQTGLRSRFSQERTDALANNTNTTYNIPIKKDHLFEQVKWYK